MLHQWSAFCSIASSVRGTAAQAFSQSLAAMGDLALDTTRRLYQKEIQSSRFSNQLTRAVSCWPSQVALHPRPNGFSEPNPTSSHLGKACAQERPLLLGHRKVRIRYARARTVPLPPIFTEQEGGKSESHSILRTRRCAAWRLRRCAAWRLRRCAA